MSVAAPDIARVLFWILAVAVVFLPRRWALLAYLVIIQVDVSGPGWASPTAVGLENGIKVVALPLILLVRTSSWELLTYWTRPLKLWLLFTAYVALAGLWSPYPISAIKMVGYLLAYAVIFLVFAQAWRQRLLDMKQVIAALWLSLLLAVIQSYLLGNAFGAPPKLITEQARFTTFAPPQSYAAFLLSCGVLLLFVRRGISGSLWNIALCLSGAAVAAGLLLVASRYVTVGALTLLVVAGFARIQPQLRGRTIDRAMLVKPALLSLTALILLFSSAAIVAPDNRIFALREMVAHGHFNPDAIGTFAWRLGVYRTAIDQIEARNPVEDV
ncbi:MAG TPA: hypothetical protein VHV31_00150, partial [Nitrolancea sp.]|nr:hypothetical protein [Nitrolancea sp.]